MSTTDDLILLLRNLGFDEFTELQEAILARIEEICINVKSRGAVGDGVTDDTVAIQTVIDLGAKVYIPAGEFLTSGLTYTNNLDMYGAGEDLTTLKLANDATGGILAGTLGVIGSTGEPVTALTLSGMTFDGDQLNNTAGTGALALLHAYACARVRVRCVRFTNGVGYGAGFQGHPSNVSAEKRGPITDVRFDSCEFINNGYYQGVSTSADGIDVKDSERITLIDCFASGNSDKGFNLRGRFITLEGCRSYSNGIGYDFNSHNDPALGRAADSYIQAVSCTAKGNIGAGFAATATENSITYAQFIGCDGIDNGGSGLNVNTPPLTGKVRLIVIGGNYNYNTLRGLGLSGAEDVRAIGVVTRYNAGDGVRTDGILNGAFFALRSEDNGAFGFRINTTSSINLVGGSYANNTSGALTGVGFRISGNPIGVASTITSAATISITARSRPLVTVTGSVTVTSIDATYAGDEVTLLFGSTAQLTDGSNLKLVGDFVGGATRVIRLICDGTNWLEVSRSIT